MRMKGRKRYGHKRTGITDSQKSERGNDEDFGEHLEVTAEGRNLRRWGSVLVSYLLHTETAPWDRAETAVSDRHLYGVHHNTRGYRHLLPFAIKLAVTRF